MALEQGNRFITLEDYMALPEGCYDLIEGELFVTPAPLVPHQELAMRLYVAIGGYVRANRLGKAYPAPTDVYFRSSEPAVVLQPDLLFVTAPTKGRLTRRGVEGPPDLVVEIVSDMRIDGNRKRAIYERFGVPELWLILPELSQIEILRLGPANKFGRPALHEAPDVVTTPLLPGFGLDLTDFFEPWEGEPA